MKPIKKIMASASLVIAAISIGFFFDSMVDESYPRWVTPISLLIIVFFALNIIAIISED